MDGHSLNLSEERLKVLKDLFPEVFSEGKLDYDRLKTSLDEGVFFKKENYELSWPGKSNARREIQRQTTATLVPDHKASLDFDDSDNIFIEAETPPVY